MKKDIYIEVQDVIKNYSDFKESDVFNTIHEKMYVFDKNAIENNLGKKLDEVLLDLYQPSFHSSGNILFNVPLYVDLIKLFSDYLEFRYNYDHVFHQGFRHIDYEAYERTTMISIKDFTILDNRFFDSQAFYFHGRIDPFLNKDLLENSQEENRLCISGIDGGRMDVYFPKSLSRDIFSVLGSEEDVNCLFRGTVSFNPNLMKNIINSSHIYYV